MIDFFNSVYFESNVASAKCPFLMFFGHLSFRQYVLSVRCLLAKFPFCHLSFSLMLIRSCFFRSYVLSVICLSAIGPFGHFSLGHLSYHQIEERPVLLEDLDLKHRQFRYTYAGIPSNNLLSCIIMCTSKFWSLYKAHFPV